MSKLMTYELRNRFKKFPLDSQDGKGINAEIVAMFFNLEGPGTWIITEGEEREDGDWLLYGYCNIFEWEWGYVMLSDLEELEVPVVQFVKAAGHKVKEFI